MADQRCSKGKPLRDKESLVGQEGAIVIDFDDLRTLRAWQQRNRRALYIGGGTFALIVLIAELILVFKGLK